MLLVFIFLQFLAIINLKQSFLICSFNLFFMVVQIFKTTAIGLFSKVYCLLFNVLFCLSVSEDIFYSTTTRMLCQHFF